MLSQVDMIYTILENSKPIIGTVKKDRVLIISLLY